MIVLFDSFYRVEFLLGRTRTRKACFASGVAFLRPGFYVCRTWKEENMARNLTAPGKFGSIIPFTQRGSYAIDVPWVTIEESIKSFARDAPVETDPDFQRAHVWNETQQRNYVEYIMRGGYAAREIFWNCATWGCVAKTEAPLQLVDGKQRLEAVRKFLRGELRAFGYLASEWDRLDILTCRMRWYVNDLRTRAQVLSWYLDLNSGGVVHTDEELTRVRALLVAENTTKETK